MTTQITSRVSLVSVLAALGACGGGGSDAPQTAPLSLRVTDAPVDRNAIDRVCIQFSGVTVHYASQDEVVLPYAPLPAQVSSATHCTDTPWDGQAPAPPVKLDALGGALTVALADSLQVPVGRITWIRLHFIPSGSFIVDNLTGRQDLRCPSCEVTDNNQRRGFKLNRTLEVEPSGIAVTVDVDLSKSLHMNGNEYVLRPTARLELDNTIGTIAGTVTLGAIDSMGGEPYSGGPIDTGCAVYVYAGAGAVPDDHHDDVDSTVVTAARVRFDVTTGAYRFAAGALVDDVAGPKPYTVALTCSADDPMTDDPQIDDTATELDTPVLFGMPHNVDVNAGATTTISIED